MVNKLVNALYLKNGSEQYGQHQKKEGKRTALKLKAEIMMPILPTSPCTFRSSNTIMWKIIPKKITTRSKSLNSMYLDRLISIPSRYNALRMRTFDLRSANEALSECYFSISNKTLICCQ